MCFDFLSPGVVVYSELNSVFRVILEFIIRFVLFEVFLCTESACYFHIPLLLDAPGIAINRLSISDALAHDSDPTQFAFAIQAHLSLTGCLRTWFPGMTRRLTLVNALFAFLATLLSTSILHERLV